MPTFFCFTGNSFFVAGRTKKNRTMAASGRRPQMSQTSYLRLYALTISDDVEPAGFAIVALPLITF
jgi:hypothetical protein